MAGLRTFIIVAVIALAIAAYSSLFIVDQRQAALVTRFGEIQRVVTDPGLYVKVPVIDELIPIEKRVLNFESTDMAVQVTDGRRYLVDSVTMLRVVDPKRFRETVGASLRLAWARIKTRLDAALRQTYGRRNFDAALSKDRAAMMREIRDQVRPEALALGIEVVDVRIRRTDLMPEVMNDTYERMNAERFAEAAQLRAVGQAEAARIRAEADREAVELVAQARRQGEITRGEGDGERNRVFAEAYQKDPEFFSFYRSMQAYAKSLADAATTLVLSPTSEFFKYFGGKSSAAPAPSTPQGSQAKPPTTPAPGESRATPAEPANEAPTATP
jgi:modulator of FtsH protease HflC